MITRAIVREVLNNGTYKVFIPTFSGMADNKGNLPSEIRNVDNIQIINQTFGQSNLEAVSETAHVCVSPFSGVTYQPNDVVFVGFEDNDLSKPVILGLLQSAINARSITSNLITSQNFSTAIYALAAGNSDLARQSIRNFLNIDSFNQVSADNTVSNDQKSSIPLNTDDVIAQTVIKLTSEKEKEDTYTTTVNKKDYTQSEFFSNDAYEQRRYDLWVCANNDKRMNLSPPNGKTGFRGYCAMLAKGCVSSNKKIWLPRNASSYWGGNGIDVVNNFRESKLLPGWQADNSLQVKNRHTGQLYARDIKERCTQFYRNSPKSVVGPAIISFRHEDSNDNDYGHAFYIDSICINRNKIENSTVLFVDNFDVCKTSSVSRKINNGSLSEFVKLNQGSNNFNDKYRVMLYETTLENLVEVYRASGRLPVGVLLFK